MSSSLKHSKFYPCENRGYVPELSKELKVSKNSVVQNRPSHVEYRDNYDFKYCTNDDIIEEFVTV